MREDRCIGMISMIFLMVCTILFVGPVAYAYPSNVTLAWDPNSEPNIAGYRLFSHQKGENFDYGTPVWEGEETSCTIQVTDGTNWYFVVRAVNTAGYESGDSNVVVYYPSTQDKDGDGLVDADETGIYATDPEIKDTDGDGLDDSVELNFWGTDWDVDYDGDGLHNLLDPDADNDGALDSLEVEGGFDPSDPASYPPSGTNQQPQADAGPDQTVDEGQVVLLDASNSTDPDDGIASYHWAQLDGSAINLSDPNVIQPTFTAPDVGPEGASLTFELTVTDSGDLQSSDTCIVNVTWQNVAPHADAGLDQTVNEGSVVTLDGSYSLDIDDGIVSYSWNQINGPAVLLSNLTSCQTTFTAPNVVSDGVSLTFNLTVMDAGGLKDTDSCIVNITWQNEPPTAVVVPDYLETTEGTLVILDGSASTDFDDGIESYLWSQVEGDPVSLTDSTSSVTMFTAPKTYSLGRHLKFKLTVTDFGGLQGSAENAIYVSESEDGFVLTVTAYKIKGDKYADLTWSGATSTNMDIYRDGSLITTTENDGAYTHGPFTKGKPATYQACEAGTSSCSNQVTVDW
jgi:hypothetical protein